jgi:hypothetical protein
MNLVTVELCSALKTLAEPLGHWIYKIARCVVKAATTLPDYLRALVD